MNGHSLGINRHRRPQTRECSSDQSRDGGDTARHLHVASGCQRRDQSSTTKRVTPSRSHPRGHRRPWTAQRPRNHNIAVQNLDRFESKFACWHIAKLSRLVCFYQKVIHQRLPCCFVDRGIGEGNLSPLLNKSRQKETAKRAHVWLRKGGKKCAAARENRHFRNADGG